MERIRTTLVETQQYPLLEAEFVVKWTVTDFMRSQYGDEFPGLGSVVVLTSSVLYAQATTCVEYVKATWPRTGPYLIDIPDATLRGPSTTATRPTPLEIGSPIGEPLHLSIDMRNTPSGELVLRARGTYEELIVELAQQIAWIGSALITSPFGDQLAYARPLIRGTSSPSRFEMTFERKPLHATETASWLPLFCGAVIASGFPIPNRSDEVGLEIPLELLAGIAGVRHAFEYNGGVVMKGFSHMFVPVRKEADRVQWHAIISQRNGPYQRIVSAAEKTPVVLYDTGERRAWLVPATDVLLHMAQHRHRLEPFEVNGKRIELETNVPVGHPAKKVLLAIQSLPLSKDEYTFKHLILDMWSLLEFLIDQNVSSVRKSSWASIKGSRRDFVNGFKFKAVVEERSPFREKQTPLKTTSGGWPLLVCDIDALVLLADGFEDIIVPDDNLNSGLCRSWQRLPKGNDYLATSTKMLKELYDVAGCRLNRNYLTSTQLQWHQGDSILFESCKYKRVCECNRLQQILPKSVVGTIRRPELILDQGAVIFGHPGYMMRDVFSRARTEEPASIYSQPNAPLTPIVIPHDSEDPSFSDGDTTGRSGSEVTVASSTNTLSSDTTPSDVYPAMDTPIPDCSRKRHRPPEMCIELSDKEGEDHEPDSLLSHKRTKNIPADDASYLSPLQHHHRNPKDAPERPHSRPDSIMQVIQSG
ncbi:hypothetical protein M011DRAFT_514110 [Sporormia fimetaria CBS 119925]|uniref:Uncharacterized protein n=1 Tax=Sporormia fimetaria CBS 119925 TaxID=1340428 RepID=A0A6A6UU01_9PLEO|nr:hypothetical protein M011DRAFT_514110 [Sporormia fimetaria CBS 119925]